jgi:hypothetical protein
LSLAKSRPWAKRLLGEVRLHQLSSSQEKWSSFTELFRGGMATLTRWVGAHRESACDGRLRIV